MSIFSKKYFHDEAAAFAKLESIVWPDGPTCPHCGNAGKIYALKGVRSKPSKKNPEGIERHGLKKCAECRKQFTVRIGTVFEESHVPLHKWLQAAFVLASSKKGVSAHQLHRALEVTYKTAWFMCHRLREAMRSGALEPFGGAGKVVEADETYYGKVAAENLRTVSDRGTPFKGSRHGRGPSNKRAVISLVERGGQVRSFHVPSANRKTVEKIVSENVHKESRLHTDESQLYNKTKVKGLVADHETVRHSADEYVRGDVTSNTVESYFSVFKRGMRGTYQHCAEKHLHRYLAEFDFRYNNRSALGVEDMERTDALLSGISGKRLTYRWANV